MKIERAISYLLLVAATLFAPVANAAVDKPTEELARARTVARAHFQNEHFAKAAEVYRRCVELSPKSVVDWINLAVAEGKARETPQALASAREAFKLDDSYLQSLYLIGLMSYRAGDMAAAESFFSMLLDRDPLCVPALYAQAQALHNLGRDDEAAEKWERVIRLDSNHGPTFYQLFRYFTRRGDSDKAGMAFEEFIRIKDQGLGPGKTEGAAFRSRYFQLLEEEVPVAHPASTGKDILVTLERSVAVRGVDTDVLAVDDFDNDGDDDIFASGNVYRNVNGRFDRVESAMPPVARIDAVAFGDIDNDGTLDIATVGDVLSLSRGDGNGSFERFFTASSIATAAGTGVVRLVDIDHEGDLDILFAAPGGTLTLLRNNGNSTFTDVTAESGIVGEGIRALLVSDLESDFDVDILFIDSLGRPQLYVNERDGTFLLETEDSGLDAVSGAVAVVVGDLNNDANPDLVFFAGTGRSAEVWLNRGDARFYRDESSPVLARRTLAIGSRIGHLADLDNDGDLDLLTAGDEMASFRNDGAGGWSDWTTALHGAMVNSLNSFCDGDFDGDGDVDLAGVSPEGRLELLRNDGGNANRRVRVRLTGTKNNLDGFGAKVWTRQGSFFQVRESFRRWTDLGVGDRAQLDVIGVRWPTGVTQNEIDVQVDGSTTIEMTERPGLAESCPFVYAYDGTGFRFVADILDATPLGVSLSPGVPFEPNHREALLLAGDQLVASEGRFSIRMTQELREITYLDRVELFVIDHPVGSSVIPNDHFEVGSPPERGLHLAEKILPPVSASNGEGRDVLDAVLRADRVYADDCDPISKRYPGITETHRLILDPGALDADQALMLFLRGTTLWTEASINVAVSQNPDIQIRPISLDVVGYDGEWIRIREDIGVPSGMDKFLPIDLKNVFPTADRRVRISTNMAVLWDQAFFAVGPTLEVEGARIHRERLRILDAELHYRGFSEIYSPDDNLPDLYDYDAILPDPLFEDVHAGNYTRYGKVTELLTDVDDRFVILAPGDEIAMEFPAIMLPDLPDGWERDFVFEADGWIKDGDLRTRTGDAVAPLPFHGMSAYPYVASEEHLNDALHRSYLQEYHTRTLPPWTSPLRRP